MRKSVKNEFDTDEEQIFLDDSDDSIRESFKQFQRDKIVNMLVDEEEEESKSSYETSQEIAIESEDISEGINIYSDLDVLISEEKVSSSCVKSSKSCILFTKNLKDKTVQGGKISDETPGKKKKRLRKIISHREFYCGCGKAYASYPALYLHIKQKHPQIRPSKRNLLKLPLSSPDKVDH
jgi:hypothetical protein